MDLYREKGEAGLVSRPIEGRPPKLTEDARARLKATIIERLPSDVGLGAELWTLPLLRRHIATDFGVELHPTNISRMLAKMGLTPQRPTRRALERDEAECRRWATNDFPEIVRDAKTSGATILFEDETGVHENTPLETTWGERGKRPVVVVPGTRRRVNVISALSPYGNLWFRCYKGNLNAAVFVAFLAALLHDVRGKIVLIIDKHPAHIAKMTRQFIEKRSDRLTVHYLPGYAPDMNPDEHAWGHLKRMFRQHPLAAEEDIEGAVDAAMAAIRSDRKLVRAFFEHPEAKYIRAALNW